MHQRNLIICDTENDEEREEKYLHYCEGIRTQGIIVTEGHRRDLFRSVSRNGQRIVIMDRAKDRQSFGVRSDSKRGVHMVIDYLYELGHRNIGFAGGSDSIFTAMERMTSFLDALRAKGASVPRENILFGSLTPQTGVEALDYFSAMKNRPTAVVCCNDQIASGFIMRAYKKRIRVPRDFSLTGFDGCLPDYFTPKITTVKQDIPAIANELYSQIFAEDADPRNVILPVTLEVGDSCREV
jgi:DNA-binding LacI/PurR family transcriptional regulator